MAQRAPSLRSCGCVVPFGVLCQHARARDRQRPTARERGYDTEYQAAAAEYLKARRWCTCGARAVLVRHVISVRLRPDLRMDQSNWLPGCRSCNAKDAHRDRAALLSGQLVPKLAVHRGVVGTLADRAPDRLGPRLGTQPIFSSSRAEDQKS